MRATALSLVAAALLAVVTPGPSPAFAGEGRGTLRVVTTGYEGPEGYALLALCTSEKQFETIGQGFRFGRVKPENGRAVFVFDDLAAGDYAVKVFQDADGDETFDIGMFGPEEVYGFSNDARGLFGPPSWEASRFHFTGDDQTIEIAVH